MIKTKIKGVLTSLKQRFCSHTKLHNSDGTAECSSCGKSFWFWYCPDSPDHGCYYYSAANGDGTRFVKLSSGVEHQLPNHDGEYETEDDCLFCHAPEERK